jgi:hypothetical protein
MLGKWSVWERRSEAAENSMVSLHTLLAECWRVCVCEKKTILIKTIKSRRTQIYVLFIIFPTFFFILVTDNNKKKIMRQKYKSGNLPQMADIRYKYICTLPAKSIAIFCDKESLLQLHCSVVCTRRKCHYSHVTMTSVCHPFHL